MNVYWETKWIFLCVRALFSIQSQHLSATDNEYQRVWRERSVSSILVIIRTAYSSVSYSHYVLIFAPVIFVENGLYQVIIIIIIFAKVTTKH